MIKNTRKTTERPRRKKKRAEPEYELQSACVEWFQQNRPDWVLMAIPVEATYARKDKFKRSGTLSGSPDLILVTDTKIIFVEMKSSTGRCSQVQKELHHKLRELASEVHVVRTLEHFQSLCQ